LISKIRIGNGYDVHQFDEGRKLFLGGVEIPYKKGLLGHSDADVLLHAIADSLLGALALGDIGKYFPNTDPRFKDYDSLQLLSETYDIVKSKGFRIINIDSMLILEKPKVSPYIEKMRENISSVLGLDTELISIKATTSEKLGFVGRGEGAEAYAVCLLEKVEI